MASILIIGQLLVHDIQCDLIDTLSVSNDAVSVRFFTLGWLLLFDQLNLALALPLASSLLSTITLHLSLWLGSNPVILLVLS